MHAKEDKNVTYVNAVDSGDVPGHPETFHTQQDVLDDFPTSLPIGQSQPTVGWSVDLEPVDLQALQQADPDISTVLGWVEGVALKPPRGLLRGWSVCLRKLWT